jgi:hypothetical protein
MGTAYIYLTPEEGLPLSSNFPAYVKAAGSNFPVGGLYYDASTQETAYWTFVATGYASGNLTLEIYWYADSATADNVVWEAAIAAITPDSDSQDVETKSFDSINYVQDTHLGTTGQRLHKATLTINNLDSIADGDLCVLKIARDADGTNATDDMTGDAVLEFARLSYTT